MNLCDFFIRFCGIFLKFCGIFINFIRKKREKFKIDCSFLPLLIKEEEIWVMSRIHFGVLWAGHRVQKSKTEKVAINVPT